ncbi:MAG: NAD-dependent epimerase/dehydratase family protein [Phycisphaerales bacterium]|nr:NAD-dependent epimerase/dehydratase family protein [Phycisphaerales bacterium]
MSITLDNKTILVTGGAGYIGSHVVQQLHQRPCTVRVLDRPGVDTAHLGPAEIRTADIRDAVAVREAADGCDIVLHLAANPNLWARDPHEFEAVNHQGTRNVLQAAADVGSERTVYVSTESILTPRRKTEVISEDAMTELGDMVGPYCRSKWLAEQAAFEAARNGQPVVIARPSIPVGPGDHHGGPLTRMIRDFQAGRIKGWMAGDLNLIDVRDVASGIITTAERGEIGEAYLLVNENWTIREFLHLLAEFTGRRAPRFRVPYHVALAFAHCEEAICRWRRNGHVPMATVTGVKLTRRCFRFDGHVSARRLGLAPYRDCRESIRTILTTASNGG